MRTNKLTAEEESYPFKVITYSDEVSFKYKLPDEEEERSIEHDITIVWEDTLEKFIEEHGEDKPYRLDTFKREREYNNLIEQTEELMDDLIDEVQEEIAGKMKFGFDFSGQLHNDD
ncbi:MAG: Unknown protein [uncultured Sulfurovum sp.]|uniref:Uncharacterized protein n=1 Tax=uncultured Sulfurovum sp. TaxID=269237 RepID=A0A6S6U3B1_9BACT|nr:MAG: Unknown protein [uncultured Sulfurovum sp.]